MSIFAHTGWPYNRMPLETLVNTNETESGTTDLRDGCVVSELAV